MTQTLTMTAYATITITSGPDRGKVFEVVEEMVHLGKGPENHLELSDPLMVSHQASILNRGGRFAIYTPLDHTIEVDGSVIPAERWVWLPEVARVRVSDYTSFQFNMDASPREAPPAPSVPTPQPSGSPPPLPAKPTQPKDRATPAPQHKTKHARGKAKESAHVARFITNTQGDALVKLGEDGQLPELRLDEGAQLKPKKEKSQGGASVMIYVLVGLSMLASLAMLFMDMEPGSEKLETREEARKDIRRFDETFGREPKLYQRYLLEARMAFLRGDRGAEVQHYRRVLNLMNAQDLNRLSGLTGKLEDDQELRRLIGIIISGE